MSDDADVEITSLVKALTRTPTLFGVPYMYAMFNMVVTAVVSCCRRTCWPACSCSRSTPSATC